MPRAVRQVAREGTFLAGEKIEPGARILSSWPLCLVQALWVVAAGWMFPDCASLVFAPLEIAKCLSYWR